MILKPGANRIETLYVPSAQRASQHESEAGMPPGYSPWALLPGLIFSPAEIHGVQPWTGTTGLTYVVSGPPRADGSISYGSYPRVEPPSVRREPQSG